ncbi:TonB-dependent receptor [candidate division KSB1 bacterium]|nr:TonB-dependent receptor [candidate division KSB1 bacterium]
MKTLFSKTTAILAIILISTAAFAQGTLRGVVTDSLTKEALPGANVFLVGTALGSATDLEGAYRIDRVPEGTYTLRVSYIGYQTKTIRVNIENNRAIVVNVNLASDAIELGTVVVTGQAEGQVAAINQQITSNTIINVVSEQKIQELPDANAAESVGRLPGVSIRRSGGEANKIVLRGLSDKYSTFTVDGVRIAPTDPDARGVDLSTISQGSLAGIELYKALTPDKDADAIAGSVNLVTKKAPSERLLRLDSKGSYNRINDTYGQYDFTVRYGERFFNEALGVQVSGNLEQRDRSKENIDLDYNTGLKSGTDYEITEFNLNYTDELRDRGGLSVLLDLNTPDGGSIRLNNIYNKTKRDFIEFERNYPTTGEELFYSTRDRQQRIRTHTSSITGQNFLFGLNTDWGLSYSDSKSDFPFDFEMSFLEASTPTSGMRGVPQDVLKGPPELIIPYAYNNFSAANLYTAYYRTEESNDTERTAFLNLGRKYLFGNSFSGEFRIGGKYRDRTRDRSRGELLSPYYNTPFARFVDSSGVIVRKNFAGTRFEDLKLSGELVLMTNFLDPVPASRDIYGSYSLYPLFNRDAIREWWELNRKGYLESQGRTAEYRRNLEPDALFYDITERVSAGYVMNTFNFGQKATLIAGLRVEHEDNDYLSRFSRGPLSGFPVPQGIIQDTSAAHQETVWLPNFHLTLRPLEFLNFRFAVYKALARPDFNHRLANVVTRSASFFYAGNSVTVGNPNLEAAKAWNYEINTSLFNNELGLFSVSVFYKDVKDMFHVLNGMPYMGPATLNGDTLDLNIGRPFEGQYLLTFPYNSTRPTHVKGIEVEHQANLRFLPGVLKNVVLSYNFSFIESETFVPVSFVKRDTTFVPGIPFPIVRTSFDAQERKEKLEGQPEFFGNFALGYDIGGFSARVSVFHQGKFNQSFSVSGRGDVVTDAFTRWDLAIKQQITKDISVLLNVNNITSVEEGSSIANRVQGWDLLNESEKYGLTADLGVRVTF